MHVLISAEGTGWEESARLAVAAGFHRNKALAASLRLATLIDDCRLSDDGLPALMALADPSSQTQQPVQRLPRLEKRLGGAQEALRTFLLGAIDRWSQGLGLVHQLGVLPHTSIKNKFPYSREALAHPERAARPSFRQERAARLHAACAACPPDVSALRARPKRARDAFGPGMVFVVNTVLAWLMFSIDVRNNMLR